MKYAFGSIAYSSVTSWLPAYTLEETMKRLARLGYDGIEVACGQPHAWPYYLDDKEIKAIGDMQKKYGIKISSVLPVPGGGPGCNAASANKKEREWTIQYMKKCIDMAYAWDAKRLLYVAGWAIFGTPQREAYANTLDTLKQVASYAGDKGVTVCIENTAGDSNVIDSPWQALELMEDTGLPNVGVMFDTAHAIARNDLSSDYVYTMGKNLKHVHFADYDRFSPGMKGYDFTTVMQALKDIGFDGYVTMESAFCSRSFDADSQARISLGYLKEIEKNLL